MHNKNSSNNFRNSKRNLRNFYSDSSLTAKIIVLTIIFGLFIVFYNIGKAVAEKKITTSTNFSFLDSQKQKDNLENVKIRWNEGNWEFSSNNGDTWSRTPPEGVYEDAEGRLWYSNYDSYDSDTFSEEDFKRVPVSVQSWEKVMIKKANHKWKYSYDDGKTWTEKKPNYYENDQKGKLSWQTKGGKKISEFDTETKKWRYSEDGGKTWSNKKP